MKTRFLTSIVIVAIFIPLLVVNEMFYGFQILMIGLSMMASYEMISMYETKKKFPGVSKYVIMACSTLVYLSAIAEWAKTGAQQSATISYQVLKLLNINIGFLPMMILVVLILLSLLVIYDDFDGIDIGKALTVICYSGLGFASLSILRAVGLRFVLYMFTITILSDVFAYIFGSMFGRHKMCPHISPKKTWEGAVAGTLIAVVVATILAFFYGSLFAQVFGPDKAQTLFHDAPFLRKSVVERLGNGGMFFLILIISFLTSIVGTVGDLVASKLKRTYGLKDYGYIFPGHGGVLDRLDSALLASVFLLSIFSIMSQIGV